MSTNTVTSSLIQTVSEPLWRDTLIAGPIDLIYGPGTIALPCSHGLNVPFR